MSLVGRTEHAAHFPHDEQTGILDLGDAVVVVLVLVVDAVADIGPMRAAISGRQQGAIGTHGKTCLGVFEPDIQQGCFAVEVFELLGPGRACIGTGKNLCIVPDGPAMRVVGKIDRRQQLPARHFGLSPGLALIIGIQNVAPVAHDDQPRTGMGHVEQ